MRSALRVEPPASEGAVLLADSPATTRLPELFGRLRADVFIYGVTLAVPKLLAVLVVPVYTRRLTAVQYGTLQVGTAIAMVLTPIFTLGMDGSQSYYFFAKNRDGSAATNDVITGVLQLRIMCGVALFTIVALILAFSPHRGFVVAGFPWYLLVATAGVCMEQVSSQAADIFRLLHRPRAYAITTGFQAFAGAMMGVLLAIGLGWGVLGVFLGTALAAAVTAGAAWFRLRALVRIGSRGITWWPRILSFGLPLLPAALGVMLLHSLDRLLLAAFRGPEDVAVYGAGAELAGIAALLVASFRVAWWPIAMQELQEGHGEIFGSVARLYLGTGAILGILSAYSFPLAIAWLLPARYAASATIAALIPWRWLCYGFFLIASAGIWKSERTMWGVLPILLALAVNAVAGVLLIPGWGIHGAAWAAIAGSLAWVVSVVVVSERLHPIGYPYGVLLLQAAIGLGTTAMLLWLWNVPRTGSGVGRLALTIGASLALAATMRSSAALFFGARSAAAE